MRSKQVRDTKVDIPLCALLSLTKRAKQSEILFKEKKDLEKKILRQKAELSNYQAKLKKVRDVRTEMLGKMADAGDVMFHALVSIETRLRVFNTSGLLDPQIEWIMETRRIALDALGKIEKEGK